MLRHWPREAKFDANGWRFVPDPDKCVLVEDDGTKPTRIELQSAASVASAEASSGTPFEEQMSRALESYHRKVQQDWDDRWSRVVDDAGGA